jgi:hypothetical protein
MQRHQVRAAVWPILEFDTGNGPIRFTLVNKGVGPAIIGTFLPYILREELGLYLNNREEVTGDQ